jgi:hypothetical protein
VKSRTYPDPKWEVRLPLWKAGAIFFVLWLYWLAPLLLISSGAVPPNALIAACVAVMVLGTFLVFGADAQKYYHELTSAPSKFLFLGFSESGLRISDVF